MSVNQARDSRQPRVPYLKMTLAVVLLLAAMVLIPSAGARQVDDLALWLSEPGVRLLAVDLYDARCESCRKDASKWATLLKTYRSRGLRVVVVSTSENGRCPSPEWIPDKTICDLDGTLLRDWFTEKAPESFLWDWQGRLLASHSSVTDIETLIASQLKRPSNLILGTIRNETGAPLAADQARRWRRHLSEPLRALGKFTLTRAPKQESDSGEANPVVPDDPAELAAFPQCAKGHRLGAWTLLSPTVYGDPSQPQALAVSMYNLDARCRVAAVSQETPGVDESAHASALIARLITSVIGSVSIPGAGAATIERSRKGGQGSTPDSRYALVTIITEPEGARVRLGDVNICTRTPCAADLPLGPQRLEFSLERFEPLTQDVDVHDGMDALVVDLRQTFGVLDLSSDPAGVAVAVNGSARGRTPLEINLRPGRHRVAIDDARYQAQSWNVTLEKGTRTPLAIAPQARMGALIVNSPNLGDSKEARVLLNGRDIGATGQKVPVMVGDYDIVVAVGAARGLGRATVEEGRTTELSVAVDWRIDLDWVAYKAGWFEMGGGADKASSPSHKVRVASFKLARTETTISQYRACVASGACSAPKSGSACNWGRPLREDHPVNCVDWSQAATFCDWAGGRLPSEAEWEFAARSGKTSPYPWGRQTADCSRAVMAQTEPGCGERRSFPVCSKPEGNSADGLCDMAGNVSEWVQDVYHEGYDGAPRDSQPWLTPSPDSRSMNTLLRIVRGGGYQSDAWYLQTTVRRSAVSALRDYDVGFRCAGEIE